MIKNNKKIIILIIILITILFIIYKNFIEGEINTNILENTEENDNNKEKSDTNQKIIVYITGEINNPGIYELEENSRIADCIEKAGGIKENADITDINLATILEDGEKIYKPAKGKFNGKSENDAKEEIRKKTEEKTTGSSTKISPENKQKNAKININTATQTELETLPGIGISTAIKIIEYRKENGKFKNIEEIKNVKGIGENKFKKIKELIKV